MVRQPTTRRCMMKATLGLAAGTAVLAVGTAARAQGQKVAQNLVQYQDHPKDGAVCKACVNWVEPNACTIVEGNINPQGWCVAYAPKEG